MNELVMLNWGQFGRDANINCFPVRSHELWHGPGLLQNYTECFPTFAAMDNTKDFEACHFEHAESRKPENDQIQVLAEDQALIRRKVCMDFTTHLLFI